MKKLLITVLGVGLAAAVYGQGQVNMNTLGGGQYLRFSNTVTTAWAVGPDVKVGLYWGVDASSCTNLVGALATLGTSGSSAGVVLGTTGGGNRTIPGRAGMDTYFQLRAWSANATTWEDAWNSGTGVATLLAATPVVHVSTQADASSPVPQIPWGNGGTTSTPLIVSLVAVPEPSVIALGVLGLLGTLFIRRRK